MALFKLDGANPQNYHEGMFSSGHRSVITVQSEDSLRITDIPSSFGGRLEGAQSLPEVMQIRKTMQSGIGPHTVVGPIHLAGADQGDVVEIEIENMVSGPVATNFCLPSEYGLGALPDEFPQGFVHKFDIAVDQTQLALGNAFEVPIRPFPGIAGVLREEAGDYNTIEPGNYGGNIDSRYFSAGNSLFLPVYHPEAKIYFGDFHAAQGDGEINLTALETGAREFQIRMVLYKTPKKLWFPVVETDEEFILLGFGGSLDDAFTDAAKKAVWFLTEVVGAGKDMSYTIASCGVNFGITQVVNRVKGVHAIIEKSSLRSERTLRSYLLQHQP